MSERSSGVFWAVLASLALTLVAGALLGTKALGGAETDAPPAPGERFARLIAPEDVCPGSSDRGAPVAVQQGTMVCLLNYARRARGLPELVTSPVLMRSTRIKADDIVRCGQWSHTACGFDVRSAFERAGYVNPYVTSRYGENLALGSDYAGTPHGALLGWLSSRAHRENLLRTDWAEQGIALVYVRDFRGVADTRIWVSHFGRRG